MFEKLLISLKQSLPEPLRKKLGIEVENTHDDHSEEQSEESHDSSSNESTGVDKKKKQISMIIRVVVVIGLGYLAVDHFFLKEDPQSEIANIPTKPRKRKVKPGDKTAAVATDKTAAPGVVAPGDKAADKATDKVADKTTETTDKKSEDKTETKPVEAVPPVENINIADKKIEETAPPKVEEKPIDNTPILKTPTEPTPKTGEVKSSEQVDKSLDSLIDSVDGKDKTTDESATKKDTKLEDKIVADDIYTEPPGYDLLGRGLVYNCKEKYWACVDKSAYVKCNKNMKWNKSHGKPAECSVLNVYNSDDDCGVVQKYNISTSKPSPCQ
ncbi:MAG: hypothetical protein H7281_13335 [Bacteriovorax sp.]|nr:hypothetical protein [Bacteriovorax sp.]